jgi:hypothetical protein
MFVVTIPYLFGCTFRLPLNPPTRRLTKVAGEVMASHDPADRDGDGIRDALEDELLARFSPTALINDDEKSWPASVSWVRARSELSIDGPRTMGVVVPRHRFNKATRAGSRDEKDWTVYGHVYPREGGGVVLQYWLYFAYNDTLLPLFDHESDWEHVTVELNEQLEPEYLVLARHGNNAPGARYPWSKVPTEDGTHPIYLVAKGSHAAYLAKSEAPPWERVEDCPRGKDGTVQLDGCPVHVWRSGGDRPSPLVNVGERNAPRREADPDGFFMRYQGLWGDAAVTRFASAAPPGPPYQAGFCVNAAPGACP